MKKLCLLITCVLTVCSCKYQPANNVAQNAPKDELCAIIEGLLSSNPNAANNEITQNEFKEKGYHAIDSLVNKYKGNEFSMIETIPCNYEMMLEYTSGKNAGKYIVKFGIGKYTSNYKPSYDYDVSFMVYSIVSKEVAATLIEKKNYHLKCRLNGLVNANNFVLPSGKKYEAKPSIYYNKADKKWSFDLGAFVVEDLQFTEM